MKISNAMMTFTKITHQHSKSKATNMKIIKMDHKSESLIISYNLTSN